MIKQFAFALSLISLAACGGSSSTVDAKVATIDAPTVHTIDAAVTHTIDAATHAGADATSTGANSVGDLCSQTMACSDGAGCATFTQGATTGVCSPGCSQDSDCATGYTGPSGGTPQCVLEAQGATAPSSCAVVCTVAGTSQCPGGSTCSGATGQMFCQPS